MKRSGLLGGWHFVLLLALTAALLWLDYISDLPPIWHTIIILAIVLAVGGLADKWTRARADG
jgi:hypothetical protein